MDKAPREAAYLIFEALHKLPRLFGSNRATTHVDEEEEADHANEEEENTTSLCVRHDGENCAPQGRAAGGEQHTWRVGATASTGQAARKNMSHKRES